MRTDKIKFLRATRKLGIFSWKTTHILNDDLEHIGKIKHHYYKTPEDEPYTPGPFIITMMNPEKDDFATTVAKEAPMWLRKMDWLPYQYHEDAEQAVIDRCNELGIEVEILDDREIDLDYLMNGPSHITIRR